MPRAPRTWWGRAALAVAVLAPLTPVAAASAAPTPVKKEPLACTVTANSVNTKVDLSTVSCVPASSLSSTPVAMSASNYAIAVHYQHVNYGGTTLTVFSSGCGGSWINVPSSWLGHISSTFSWCSANHHIDFNLNGWYETTPAGGGNLSWMNDLTRSAQYW
jgi:hypothetical protein